MQRKFSFEGIEIRLVSGEGQKNKQTSEKHSPNILYKDALDSRGQSGY